MTFTSPNSGDILKAGDVVGHLLIVRPIEFLPDFQTANGARDTIRVDVVDLNANDDDGTWGKTYKGVLWFGRGMVPGLRRQIGELVLARMGQGLAKSGQSAPWVLVDALGDAQAVNAGQEWLRRNPWFEQGGPAVASPAPAPVPAAPVPAASPAPALPVVIPGANPAAPVPLPTPPVALPTTGAAVTVPPGTNPWDALSAEQKQALAALGFGVPS